MNSILNKTNQYLKEFINDCKDNLKSIKSKNDLIKQLPNIITLSRLLFIPFILINLFVGNLITAGVLTIIAALTDYLDGILARGLKVTSNFGAKLDVVCDKTFTLLIMIPLVVTNHLLIIPVIIDIMIALVITKFNLNGIKTKTSFIGKVKTNALDALVCSIFFSEFPNVLMLTNYLLALTIILQLITLYHYYNKYSKDLIVLKEKQHSIQI